jgi:hypothetical protein
MNDQSTTRIPLFPEWEAEHAQEIHDRHLLPDRITTMWRIHGKNESATCGHCQHCLAERYHNKTYYKCELYKISHSASSDWRVKWIACGKFARNEG